MSWAAVETPHAAWEREANPTPVLSEWAMKIWEVTPAFPRGRWTHEKTAQCLLEPASLRIIFAPLDYPRKDHLAQFRDVFSKLDIPDAFSLERVKSVSHSFCRQTDTHGAGGSLRTRSWFHFLCKNIKIRKDKDGQSHVINHTGGSQGFAPSNLPQADYTWLRSGFFLKVGDEGRDVVLACFGATANVQRRLKDFVATGRWDDVTADAYILFDLILEGLYLDIDEGVWNMNTVFGPLEHNILEYAHNKYDRRKTSKLPFVDLHNCAKQTIYFAEALAACAMTVDAAQQHTSPSPSSSDLVHTQLRERLAYRKSLLASTELRLSSLQRRIDNIITLSFNLVTQQDSMVMTQDSSSMRIIAAITMVFLPTTGVATVLGSQLFESERASSDGDGWRVHVSPLFWLTWWVSIPLTVFVMLLASWWTWWKRMESPREEVVRVVRRVTTFNSRK
ncbi:hypothetical protein B0I35DRAFT_483417 [Stachybotrys elegans]|uniref:Uncharacterized protein n=1 Tax=Stachybotrys elegans TaxID=80388 RepID=A0A8K0SKL5_9HYPO|nr:hypothetical protein B0I35DRAFT_483417 [Stachybotrys elegans]